MESFVIRPMTWPVLRFFSRSPLMRTTDRVEAAVAALAIAQVVAAVRAHLRRVRDAQWELEIRSLVEDDGGRTNHSQ